MLNKISSINIFALLIINIFIGNCVTDCGGLPPHNSCPATGGSKSVTVNWAASHSYDVSTAAGGGHKIYYDFASGITKSTPNVVDVPNTASLTTGTISGLTSGCTYYVRVGGYSALNTAGGNLSPETSITVP